MGSYNGTCGVTQLPICNGDEVVVFLLIDNTYISDWDTSGHCYSNHYWAPRTIQLYGKYDDYGRYKVEDGWNLQFVLNCFQHDGIELPEETKCPGEEITKKKLQNWNFLFEAMHDDRLFVQGYGGRRHVSQMAVHRHVFDELTDIKFDHWNGKFSVPIIKESSSDYIMQMRKYLEHTLDDDDIMGQMIRKAGFNKRLFLFHPKRTIFGDCLEGIGDFGAANTFPYRELIADSLDNPELDDIITEISKFTMFSTTFSNMRKTWMPQAGAGSQSEGHELYGVVNKAAQMVINERKAKFAEDEE